MTVCPFPKLRHRRLGLGLALTHTDTPHTQELQLTIALPLDPFAPLASLRRARTRDFTDPTLCPLSASALTFVCPFTPPGSHTRQTRDFTDPTLSYQTPQST